MDIDDSKILDAIRHSIPITIKSHTLPNKTTLRIEKILELYLREINQLSLKDSLFYCIHELGINAYKANAKRMYFAERGLNINDETDYNLGMTEFREQLIQDREGKLEGKHKEQNYYVKIIFHIQKNNFTIFVVNNSDLSIFEQKRIHDRIILARKYQNLGEAFAVADSIEGAGLGIVIVSLMFKKLGLGERAFDIDSQNGETIARITIPMNQKYVDRVDEITNSIIDNIDKIPQFPEHIASIQSAIDDEKTTIYDIAQLVSTDPALITELLKIVNSAAYGLSKRIDSILEAIKYIGLKSLQKMLYTYGAQAIWISKDIEVFQLWGHSYKTAVYASIIAKNILRQAKILDDVYVGGMLHDIGKLILYASNAELSKAIRKIAELKDEDSSHMLEAFSMGLNHAEIGARLAEKWNFPEVLMQIIRFHHSPNDADIQHRLQTKIVYLANSLANVDTGRISYEQINPYIVSELKIPSIDHLKQIHDVLKKRFSEKSQLT